MKSVVLRKPDIARVTGLSIRTIDRMEARGEFPKRFPISVRCVGWSSADVQEWLDQRARQAN